MPAYELSSALQAIVDKLELGPAVAQLRDEGYTIVPEVVPRDVCDEVREAIKRLAAQEQGHYFDLKTGQGYSAFHLFGKDPAFVNVLLNPALLALTEYLCGGDFLLSQLSGSVRFNGAEAMALHMDAQWYPPMEHNPMFTACLALDDLTREAGTTKVVPASHMLMRSPTDEEAKRVETDGAIPIECPIGSLAFWNGYTWHSNYPRTVPGERVMLHLTFCRAAFRPIEDYSNISDEYLASYPPIIATMIGRNSYFGNAHRDGGACSIASYEKMYEAVRR